jgi:hypothetical protein
MTTRTDPSRLRPDAGVAYLAILLILALLSTLGLTFLARVQVGGMAVAGHDAVVQAEYLAEAAANHAMWRLLNENDFPASTNVYTMHALGAGRYGYKVRRHTINTFATVATIGVVGESTVAQSYVLYVAGTKVENLYIVDTDNHRIRKVNGSTGIITTIAGNGLDTYAGDGGLATLASIRKPRGIVFDVTGNLYIADTDNHCIRRVDGATGIITTVAGIWTSRGGYSGDGGPATSAKLKKPHGVWLQ